MQPPQSARKSARKERKPEHRAVGEAESRREDLRGRDQQRDQSREGDGAEQIVLPSEKAASSQRGAHQDGAHRGDGERAQRAVTRRQRDRGEKGVPAERAEEEHCRGVQNADMQSRDGEGVRNAARARFGEKAPVHAARIAREQRVRHARAVGIHVFIQHAPQRGVETEKGICRPARDRELPRRRRVAHAAGISVFRGDVAVVGKRTAPDCGGEGYDIGGSDLLGGKRHAHFARHGRSVQRKRDERRRRPPVLHRRRLHRSRDGVLPFGHTRGKAAALPMRKPRAQPCERDKEDRRRDRAPLGAQNEQRAKHGNEKRVRGNEAPERDAKIQIYARNAADRRKQQRTEIDARQTARLAARRLIRRIPRGQLLHADRRHTRYRRSNTGMISTGAAASIVQPPSYTSPVFISRHLPAGR